MLMFSTLGFFGMGDLVNPQDDLKSATMTSLQFFGNASNPIW